MDKKETYLAHIEGNREQTVLEHLEGTADLAGAAAASFGKREEGRMAGYLHDIGKFSKGFQIRIRNPEGTERCDYSTAGALEGLWRNCPEGRALSGMNR